MITCRVTGDDKPQPVLHRCRRAEIMAARNFLQGYLFSHPLIDRELVEAAIEQVTKWNDQAKHPPEFPGAMKAVEDKQHGTSYSGPDGEERIEHIGSIERKSLVAERLEQADAIIIKGVDQQVHKDLCGKKDQPPPKVILVRSMDFVCGQRKEWCA